MNAPKLTCKSAAELRRVVDWLVLSGIACTWTQSELTISLGATDGKLGNKLDMMKAAPDLLAACKLLMGVAEWADRNGKRSITDVCDWSIVRAAIDKARGESCGS